MDGDRDRPQGEPRELLLELGISDGVTARELGGSRLHISSGEFVSVSQLFAQDNR